MVCQNPSGSGASRGEEIVSIKKFQVEIDVVKRMEVSLFCESFDEAADRASKLSLEEIEEGYVNDFEKHVYGIRRDKVGRMYR